jgi:hypothetical protein
MAGGMSGPGLTFGIYPGGGTGSAEPGGPDLINQALDELQGTAGHPFTVRAYDVYTDPGDTGHTTTRQAPAGYERYLSRGRRLDLVAQYHSRSGDVAGYCAFVEALVDRHGEYLASLQIGEEPNVTGDPDLDGAYPRVTEAIIAGVRAAKHMTERRGLDTRVGCNSTPLFGPSAGFLTGLTQAGGKQFVADLDYIGLDFFPDVFRPIAASRMEDIVQNLLEAHRRDILAAAGLGHLPLVVTECGWPTGPGRPAERQAEVLRTVVGVIARNAESLNITGYLHFALRDARSAGDGLLCQFGLMTDDYTPKPAFAAYQDLISALTVVFGR